MKHKILSDQQPSKMSASEQKIEKFESYSQARQDYFVFLLLKLANEYPSDHQGTFLDVGAHDPVHISNTFALENLGWRGLLVEYEQKFAPMYREKRQSPFVIADAITLDWQKTLEANGFEKNRAIDYLSFDIDNASLPALRNFPLEDYRFKVMTVEHDAYHAGNAKRNERREILLWHGYQILMQDVKNDNFEYEDWWVDPQFFNADLLGRLKTKSLNWQDIICQIEAEF